MDSATAAVMLRNPNDDSVRSKVKGILTRLASDPNNGIGRVLHKEQIATTAGFPHADFLVEFAPGFYLGNALRGELRVTASSKGTHGYLPARPEMHASLFIAGTGIAQGRNLGLIDIRQIAPTLANLSDAEMPSARGKTLDGRASKSDTRSQKAHVQ